MKRIFSPILAFFASFFFIGFIFPLSSPQNTAVAAPKAGPCPCALIPLFPPKVLSKKTSYSPLLHLFPLAYAASSSDAWAAYEKAVNAWLNDPSVKNNSHITDEVTQYKQAVDSKDHGQIIEAFIKVAEKTHPPTHGKDHPMVISAKTYFDSLSKSQGDQIKAYSELARTHGEALQSQSLTPVGDQAKEVGNCFKKVTVNPEGYFDGSTCLDRYIEYTDRYTHHLPNRAAAQAAASLGSATAKAGLIPACPIPPVEISDGDSPPSPATPAAGSKEEAKLIKILQGLKYDDQDLKAYNSSLTYPKSGPQQGTLNKNSDGTLVHIDASGRKTEVYISDDPKGHHLTLYTLDEKPFTPSGFNPTDFQVELDGIARHHRAHATFLAKTQNTECFLKLAKERLGSDYLKRLIALERGDNPRPLSFKTDEDFSQFKSELQEAFGRVGQTGQISILGSGATFYTQNPHKGKTSSFLKKPCDLSTDVDTFDAQAGDESDIHVHIFSPAISRSCNSEGVKGNEGSRRTYYENKLDLCLPGLQEDSRKPLKPPIVVKTKTGTLTLRRVIDLFNKPFALPNRLPYTLRPPLGDTIGKWIKKLAPRRVTFSVHILPSLMVNATPEAPDDFDNDPEAHTRFSFPMK